MHEVVLIGGTMIGTLAFIFLPVALAVWMTRVTLEIEVVDARNQPIGGELITTVWTTAKKTKRRPESNTDHRGRWQKTFYLGVPTQVVANHATPWNPSTSSMRKDGTFPNLGRVRRHTFRQKQR